MEAVINYLYLQMNPIANPKQAKDFHTAPLKKFFLVTKNPGPIIF